MFLLEWDNLQKSQQFYVFYVALVLHWLSCLKGRIFRSCVSYFRQFENKQTISFGLYYFFVGPLLMKTRWVSLWLLLWMHEHKFITWKYNIMFVCLSLKTCWQNDLNKVNKSRKHMNNILVDPFLFLALVIYLRTRRHLLHHETSDIIKLSTQHYCRLHQWWYWMKAISKSGRDNIVIVQTTLKHYIVRENHTLNVCCLKVILCRWGECYI